MNKTVRCISALGAVFFAVAGLSACGSSGVPGNAVAKVSDTPITNDAFKHWLGVAAYSTAANTNAEKAVVPDPPKYTACLARQREIAAREEKATHKKTTEAEMKQRCETAYKNFSTEVTSFLVSSQWVLSEANALKVKLTDAEVRKQFLKIKATQFTKPAEFEKFLAASHQSVSDLLLRVKLNLLSSKIQQQWAKKKPKVTDAQIEKYYNANKSRYGTPEKRSVNIILVKTEAAAKAAMNEIKSGKSFAVVAKKVSIDPTSKATGGQVSGVVKGQEAAPLDKAIFSSAKSVLVGPVKTSFGFYVFQVTSITPGNQQSLAQAKQSIKQQLTVTQNQEALSKFVKEFKKRWQSRTVCRAGYVVPDCKEYKAPKTGTGTTTTGP